MVSWLADWIVSIVNSGPALLLTLDSPRFFIARAMLGLILIVVLLLAIALWPSHWSISRLWKRRIGSRPDTSR